MVGFKPTILPFCGRAFDQLSYTTVETEGLTGLEPAPVQALQNCSDSLSYSPVLPKPVDEVVRGPESHQKWLPCILASSCALWSRFFTDWRFKCLSTSCCSVTVRLLGSFFAAFSAASITNLPPVSRWSAHRRHVRGRTCYRGLRCFRISTCLGKLHFPTSQVYNLPFGENYRTEVSIFLTRQTSCASWVYQ